MALRARVARQLESQRFRSWRKAVAASRMLTIRSSLEARLFDDSLRYAFHRLVGLHATFCMAVSELAARCPRLQDQMRQLSERCHQDRRQAISEWHVWARRRRQHVMERCDLQRLLRHRHLRGALSAWGVF